LISPLGRDLVVIDREAGVTLRVRFTDRVKAGLLESVTLKVSGVLVTGAVGVPVMAPVVAFRVKPIGRVPLVSDQV
jgi:hypothetical protein